MGEKARRIRGKRKDWRSDPIKYVRHLVQLAWKSMRPQFTGSHAYETIKAKEVFTNTVQDKSPLFTMASLVRLKTIHHDTGVPPCHSWDLAWSRKIFPDFRFGGLAKSSRLVCATNFLPHSLVFFMQFSPPRSCLIIIFAAPTHVMLSCVLGRAEC